MNVLPVDDEDRKEQQNPVLINVATILYIVYKSHYMYTYTYIFYKTNKIQFRMV